MPARTPEEREVLDALWAELQPQNEIARQMGPRPGARKVGSPGGHWRTPQSVVLMWVPPGQILTQYGTLTSGFRAQPRFDALAPMVEMDVSMVLGRLSVDEAARLVTKRPPKPSAVVRYFNTDDLYLNDYMVTLTPSERIPDHVSVHFGPPFGIKDVAQARASWADLERVTLDSLALPNDGNDQ